MHSVVPKIDGRYICIADRNAATLAAVVSSCLFESGTYVPLFLFPAVTLPQSDEEQPMTDGYMANLLGNDASILINNAWARMNGSDYAILAGLSEQQKSFLILPAGTKVIEISALADVELKLTPFAVSSRAELRCRASDILKGLCLAHQNRKRLVVDEASPELPVSAISGTGIVVVEKVTDASSVVAINYASSVDANILLVDALPEDQAHQIPQLIENWKERGERGDLHKVMEAVNARIGNTSFSDFEYATFFTEGLPYSLVLKNAIPCSHVHLSLHPDLFILNNILFENGAAVNAAVVFSPLFFLDEETQWLCDFLEQRGFYVRQLVGQTASLANFDFVVQHFPYELLHICSHGGEVSGYQMVEQFVDGDGQSHSIEFDEVIGHTPVPDKDGLVEVHRKMFPRKLDGLAWASDELRRKGFSRDVYARVWQCMRDSKGTRKISGKIPMSCSIACSDSIHQGAFHILASHSSPIVFNNACWSWYEVAKFFLSQGARGYMALLTSSLRQ